jgi:glycosyltransferase involved in cell wall biosynthesis
VATRRCPRVKVLKIWDSEYPWDVRTEKVCRALVQAGHEAHMVARNRDGRSLEERLPEATVHRMRPWRFAGGVVDRGSQFPAFFNPRWLALILSTARRHPPDLVLVRDLPLAPTAVFAARRLGVPVVLDMAENYPAMIRDLWTTGTTRLGDSIVRNPRAVAAVERWVLARVDHVLAIVEESRDRLVEMGVPEERVTIVGNTPALNRLSEFESMARARTNGSTGTRSALRLVYLGIMEQARGVGVVLEAVARARRAGTAVTVELIGDGRALDDFKAQSASLGLAPDVARFHGFIPYRDALPKVAEADAGLIPHFANESWRTTLPNKLFDYMSLGLPVVSSGDTPVARVLEESGAGITFRDRDPEDLARVIEQLSRDSASRRAMSAAGVLGIRTRYNWEADAARFVHALEGCLAERSTRSTRTRRSLA